MDIKDWLLVATTALALFAALKEQILSLFSIKQSLKKDELSIVQTLTDINEDLTTLLKAAKIDLRAAIEQADLADAELRKYRQENIRMSETISDLKSKLHKLESDFAVVEIKLANTNQPQG